MAEYNPDAPEIIGQQWVPTRTEELRFQTTASPYERGFSFAAGGTNSQNLTHAAFFIDRPSEDLLVQNKVRTINVYPAGRELETGPIKRLLIEPTYSKYCSQEQPAGLVCTDSNTDPSPVAGAYSAGDGLLWQVNNLGYNAVDFGFAVKKYRDKLLGKRILGVNAVVATTFAWNTPDGSAPQITGGTPVLEYFTHYIAACYGADTNQSVVAPAANNLNLSGQVIGIIATGNTVPYSHRLNRYTIGNTNAFYATSAPPLSTGPFNLKDWQSDQLERFDQVNGGDLRIRLQSGNQNYVPPFPSLLSIEYLRLEILYCDETRIATGSRQQSQAVVYGGPNAVRLYPILGPNTDNLVIFPGSQYTVTISNGTFGWMSAGAGDHFLNQTRQLEPISSIQGIELDFPQPMDNTAEGLYPTSQSTNLIPQIALYHDGNVSPSSYDEGTILQTSHAYGRNIAASVAPLQVLQGIYNPLGSYVTGTQFKYARFYARHATPTGDPNSLLRLSVKLSMPDIASAPYSNTFENGTLNGWTGSGGATIVASSDIAHSGLFSGKITGTTGLVTSPNIPVLPGQQYYASVWMLTTGTGLPSPTITITAYDVNNNQLLTNTCNAAALSNSPLAWSPRAVFMRAPENASYIQISIGNFAFSNGPIYVDDIQSNLVRVIEDTFDRPKTSLVVDNFHRTSPSTWGFPEIGQGWIQSTGTALTTSVSIPSNSQAQIDTSGTVNNTWIVYSNTAPFVSGADGNVTITIRSTSQPTTGEWGIVARLQDTSNYYSFRVISNLGAGTMTLYIKKMLSGTESTLNSFVYNLSFSESSFSDWILKFDLNGPVLRGWLIDGEQPGLAWASVIAQDTSFTVGRQGVIVKNIVSNGLVKFWNYVSSRMYASWTGPTAPSSGHLWDMSTWPGNTNMTWKGDNNFASTAIAQIQDYGYGGLSGSSAIGNRALHGELIALINNSTVFGPCLWENWSNFDARVEVRPTFAPTGANSFAGLILRSIGNLNVAGNVFYLLVQVTYQPGGTAFAQLSWFNNVTTATIASGPVFNVTIANPVMLRVHLEANMVMVKAIPDVTQEPPGWDIIYNLQNLVGWNYSQGFTIGTYAGTNSGNTNAMPLAFEFYRFLAYAADSYANYPTAIASAPAAAPYTQMDSAQVATGVIAANDLANLSPVVDNWREVTLELDQPFTLGDQGSLTFVGVSTDGYDARWEVLAATSMALSAYVVPGNVTAGLQIYNPAPKQYQPSLAGYASINPQEGQRTANHSRDAKVSLNDSFFRTTSNGWGTANTGQTWQITAGTPSNFQTGFNGFSGGASNQWFGFKNAAQVHLPAGSLQTISIAQVDGDTIWPTSEMMFNMLLATPVNHFGDIVRLIISWPAPLNIGQVTLTAEFRSDGKVYGAFSTAAGQGQNFVAMPVIQVGGGGPAVSGFSLIQFYSYVNPLSANVSVENTSTSLLIADVDQRLWFAPTSTPVSGNGSFSVTFDMTNSANAYDIAFGGFRLDRTVQLASSGGFYDQVRKNNYAAMSWAPQRGPTVNVPLSLGTGSQTYSSTLYEDKSTAMAVYFAPKPPAPTGMVVTQAIQALAQLNTCVPGVNAYAPTQLAYNTISWPMNTQTVLDSFSRVVSGGWGQSTGAANAWSSIGPPGYSWTDGSGTAYLTSPGTTIGTPMTVGQQIEVDSWNCDVRLTLDLAAGADVIKAGNGAQCRIVFMLRDVTLLSIYPQWNQYSNTFFLQLQVSGSQITGLDYPLYSQNAPVGGPVAYGSLGGYASFTSGASPTDAGFYDSNIPCPMNIRLQLHNTELRMKFWAVNQPEPASWFQGLMFLPNLAGPQLRSRFSITLDTTAYSNTNPYHYTVTAKISNLSITNGKNTRREIQRQDNVDPVWRTVYASANPFITTFNDYEARIGVPTSYQFRDVGYGEFPGTWSAPITTTLTAPAVSGTGGGHVLVFTTNAKQDGSGNLAYNNSWESGTPNEPYNLPEAGFTQLQLMYGKDFYTAFHPTERGGESFTRDLVVQAAAVSPKVLGNIQSLRDLAWSNVPYLCVRTEDGDRWFANVQVPSANVRFRRTLYTVAVTVTEVTLVPYPIDPLTPWGSSFAVLP